MGLTVSEILALDGLSALRLRAGQQGLQLAVRWYYVAENENIAEWIMGGELVFITGINHPRDENNLIHLLMEGKQRGIAGMVILTGDQYIQAIPPRLIALADELGIPLIEQPYLLKMVMVTERIGTALVRSENALQSQRDILLQLLTGDYPDLHILHQRALHQQLDFTRPLRVAALRLEGIPRLFRQLPPGRPKPGSSRLTAPCASACSSSSTSRAIPFRWLNAAICFSSCFRTRKASFINRKRG
jgi:hypothetical protein